MEDFIGVVFMALLVCLAIAEQQNLLLGVTHRRRRSNAQRSRLRRKMFLDVTPPSARDVLGSQLWPPLAQQRVGARNGPRVWSPEPQLRWSKHKKPAPSRAPAPTPNGLHPGRKEGVSTMAARYHQSDSPQTPRIEQPEHDRLVPVRPATDTEKKLLSVISRLSGQRGPLEEKLEERIAAMEAKLNTFSSGEEIQRKRGEHSPKIATGLTSQ
ncbi:uncharacterized protein LOC111573652 isoform X1 [Amphiprion ocellaris]|uniref:uncharacterized protein LOC129348319 n=1 Tax=Amphiprion ocellaris TaxID=80972 RepID=UPI002410D45B|nr:uncharacterized protein LOC129348319 [Amphiprion ocellaris]XP_054864512.1 uncharacterized protein LOC129348319 [Amphiprion ocellaris]XP_054864664.1 uncharacterized protein LOC129348336 [Amphiprion ocellaris]XP_054864750.1 uncharacterized protein LOC111573652 isoform X1 [Amphiprion ocellaris]